MMKVTIALLLASFAAAAMPAVHASGMHTAFKAGGKHSKVNKHHRHHHTRTHRS